MKRFLIIVLTALCCVAMAACSGGKTPDNPTIVPDSVLLADREVTVYVGGTYKFEPTGAASFTYSSSDDGIAKVTADGVLTGISDGTAFVVITAGGGDASATCRVNVIKSENYIRLGAENRCVVAGGDITIKAEAIRNGEVMDEKVEFTVDKTAGVTIVDSGENEITATIDEAGSYVITATAGDISAKCNVKAVDRSAKVLGKPVLIVNNCATLTWNVIEGAVDYAVAVNGGAETIVNGTSYDASGATDGLEFGDKAVFSVRAIAAANDYGHIDGSISTLDFAHDYRETVKTEHTCVKAGVSEFECATCGKKYTDENRLDDHIYTDAGTPRGTGACLVCGFQRTKKVNYKYDEHNDCYFVAGADGGYDSKDLYILAKYNDGTPEHGEKPVKYIGYGAFKDNKIIVRVYLPESMTEFKDNDPAFVRSNGASLNDVDGMGGKSSPLRGAAFDNCVNLELASLPGVHTLPAVAESSYTHWNFRDCYNLTAVIVPEGFNNRGAGFMRWINTPAKAANKTDIYVIGDSVGAICDAANYPIGNDIGFGNNTLLSGDVLTYDENATTETCFKWRYADDGVTIIGGGKHEFNGKGFCGKCGARNDYGVVYGYDKDFVNADGTSGAYYVADNRNLTESEVTIVDVYDDGINGEKPVKFVRNRAFEGNKFLKKITLPAGVTRLDGLAFSECANLEYVEMPGVTDLNYREIANEGIYENDGYIASDNNFLDCAKLKTVVVSPIFEINCGQFKTRNGSGLPRVELFSAGTYTESKINIIERAANDLFTGNIYYFGALNRCQRWTKDGGEIVHSDAAHNYAHGACVICGAKDDKGVVYKYESGAYYVGGYTGDGEIVEIAETWDDGDNGEHAVTYVAKKAFENKTTIKRVIMPSITDLGGQVFWGCENLEYVDMRGVTYIKYNQPGRPDGATESNNNFRFCNSLATVIVGNGYSSETGQFNSNHTRGVVNLYVYGTSTVTTHADDKILTGKIFYLGDGEKCFTWKFDDSGNVKAGPAEHNFVDGKCSVCGIYLVDYAYDSASQTYYVTGVASGITEETITIASTYNDGTHGEHAVTYVAKKAFENKTKIKRVIMPSITDLGGQVFWGCENLEYVDMRGVTYIKYNQPGRPDGATESNNNFRFCNSLVTVIVGNGYSSETGQFNSDHTRGIVDLYVYGTSTVTTHADDKILSGNVYYYSDTEKAGAWHFANGAATLW